MNGVVAATTRKIGVGCIECQAKDLPLVSIRNSLCASSPHKQLNTYKSAGKQCKGRGEIGLFAGEQQGKSVAWVSQ